MSWDPSYPPSGPPQPQWGMPQAGWYPDPAGWGGTRWWNGYSWTELTGPPPAGMPTGWFRGSDGRPYVLSGWWRRVGGLLLDNLIIGLPLGIVGLILIANTAHFSEVPGGSVTFSGQFTGWLVVYELLSVAVTISYGALLIGARGQTVGMMALGIKAVEKGSAAPLGYKRAWQRALVVFALIQLPDLLAAFFRLGTDVSAARISAAGFLQLAGTVLTFVTYLWPLGSDWNQTLQDKAVGSIVVKTR